MKKIAIIFDGNLDDRKGFINAVLQRSKHLISIANALQVDVYNFQSHENYLIRKLRQSKNKERYDYKTIDGVKIKVFWYSFSLIDYVLAVKLKKRAFFSTFAYNKRASVFKKYDLISAHSINCGKLALEIKRRYDIPYVVTWHGSDIHSAPFNNKYAHNDVYEICKNADNNFFVSNALLKTSESINSNITKTVLYNGVSCKFHRYPEEKRNNKKQVYNPSNKKVVCFAGGVIDIKNPLSLPSIFNEVNKRFREPITFWIIGDGKLLHIVEQQLKEYNLDYTCWGNVEVQKMPDMLNCVDVLVLPSKNEGLPLITIEALACGANVVGSNVGGISEAIGIENVFDLGSTFIEEISDRIIQMLTTDVQQTLLNKFNWESTAEKEYSIYKNILKI